MIRLLSILSVVLLLTGCRTPKGTKYVIPPDIQSMAHGEFNNARDCLLTAGVVVKDTATKVTVVKVDGEKLFPEGWAWRSAEHGNMWVLGLTREIGSTYKIEVGCNPHTKGEVSPSTMKHEAGHYWLMSNFRDFSHDHRYGKCFAGWIESPRVRVATSFSNGTITVVDYIEEEP